MTQYNTVSQLQDTILGQIFTNEGYLILEPNSEGANAPAFDMTTTLNIVKSINWSSFTDELTKEILTLNPVVTLAQLAYGETDYTDELREEVFSNQMRTQRVLREAQSVLFDTADLTSWYVDALNMLTDVTILKLVYRNMITPLAGVDALNTIRKATDSAYARLTELGQEEVDNLPPQELFDSIIGLLQKQEAVRTSLPEELKSMLKFEYMAVPPNEIKTFATLADELIVTDEETNTPALVDVNEDLPEEVDVPEPMLTFSNDLLPGHVASAIMTRVFVNRGQHSVSDSEAELFFDYSYLFDMATMIPYYNVFTPEQQLDSMPTLAQLYTYAMMDGQEALAYQIANLIRELNETNEDINFVEGFLASVVDFMNGVQVVDGSEYGTEGDVVILGARVADAVPFQQFTFRFMRDVAMFGVRTLPEGYFTDLASTHPVHQLVYYFLPVELPALREDVTLEQYSDEDTRSGVEFVEMITRGAADKAQEKEKVAELTQNYIDSGVFDTEKQAQEFEATWNHFADLRVPLPRVNKEEAAEVIEQP